MLRIRWHGRGGQGIKTGSRVLGTAFFLAGFEVQDAPVYGAERRGAPMSAYVRAARTPIRERGVIARPDLVVLADDTLLQLPAAGALSGVDADTLILVQCQARAADRVSRACGGARVLILPLEDADGAVEPGALGARCAGAAACLSGRISPAQLEGALREELAALGAARLASNLRLALGAFDAMAAHAGAVREGASASASDFAPPDWIELPLEAASIAAPDIFGAATNVEVRTGLWRTMRPEIDAGHCKRCSWICSTLCPDSAIRVLEDRSPEIDLVHCKGCLICIGVCPSHAIRAVAEHGTGALAEAAA